MGVTFNPFTGNFDFTGTISSGSDNFSYNVIDLGVEITIPIYQQMLVDGLIDVIGTLNIDGELALVG